MAPLAQGTEILQSTIPPEQAVDRTFSDLSTLGQATLWEQPLRRAMR